MTGKDLSGSLGHLRRDLEILRVQRDEIIEERDALQNAAAGEGAGAPADAVQPGQQQAADVAAQDGEAAPAVPAQGRAAGNAVNDNNANNNRADVGGRVITLTFGLAARNLLSSLLAPLIGRVVGSALQQWALTPTLPGSSLLQTVLGTGRAGRINSRPGSGGWIRANTGFGSIMPIGLQLGIDELDPIWYVSVHCRCCLSSSVTCVSDVSLVRCLGGAMR